MQRQEMDLEKRKRLILEMQDILAKDQPWIPISSNIRIEFSRNDTFKGWISRPLGCPPYYQFWSYLNLEPV
jgi:ABC-type transport system substrate-binding protein